MAFEGISLQRLRESSLTTTQDHVSLEVLRLRRSLPDLEVIIEVMIGGGGSAVALDIKQEMRVRHGLLIPSNETFRESAEDGIANTAIEANGFHSRNDEAMHLDDNVADEAQAH